METETAGQAGRRLHPPVRHLRMGGIIYSYRKQRDENSLLSGILDKNNSEKLDIMTVLIDKSDKEYYNSYNNH